MITLEGLPLPLAHAASMIGSWSQGRKQKRYRLVSQVQRSNPKDRWLIAVIDSLESPF